MFIKNVYAIYYNITFLVLKRAIIQMFKFGWGDNMMKGFQLKAIIRTLQVKRLWLEGIALCHFYKTKATG